MALYLKEHLTFDAAQIVLEGTEGKDLYMKGICIQGGVKNANERVYPVGEIEEAVKQLNEQITTGHSVLGEVDHPDDLKINLDRVSHMIVNMWMDGPNGFGKLKILPTPKPPGGKKRNGKKKYASYGGDGVNFPRIKSNEILHTHY